MRAGAASGESRGLTMTRLFIRSPMSLEERLPLVGYTGNGHASDERK